MNIAPAAMLIVIALMVALERRCLLARCEPRAAAFRDDHGRCYRRAGAGIVNDRLEECSHLLRRNETAPLHDLGAIRRQHDRRRPAPSTVAAVEIGIAVSVH